jgi:lipopolysaccharide export system protein LptA
LQPGMILHSTMSQELPVIEQALIGNASFNYPQAKIQTIADEIQYGLKEDQVTLRGNVQTIQKDENIRGEKATCFLEQKRCVVTQK